MSFKILFVIAPENFRDEEYLVPKEIFEKEGFEVITASRGVEQAKGKLGAVVSVDVDIYETESDDYEAIVIAGGPGAAKFRKDIDIRRLLEEFEKENKLIAAICIAPTILAVNELLSGKRATVWDDFDKKQSKILQEWGAQYTGENVTIDKNIITANGPQSASNFAYAIVKYLKKS